jgi:hypothetical protein
MLEPLTVVAVAQTLRLLEADAETRGWDAPPVLLGLFDRSPSTRVQAIEVDPSLVPPDVWNLPDPTNPDHCLPAPVVLHLVAAQLSTPQVRPLMSQWLRRDGRTFLGFGLLAEAWQTANYHGYRSGDLNAVPAMADAEVRALTAIDVDERSYQLIRVRGRQQPAVSIQDSPLPLFWQTNIPDALRHLVGLSRDQPGQP